MGIDSCVENADCTDTEGSYTCMCSSGYTGDGLSSCTSKLNSTNPTRIIGSNVIFRYQ